MRKNGELVTDKEKAEDLKNISALVFTVNLSTHTSQAERAQVRDHMDDVPFSVSGGKDHDHLGNLSQSLGPDEMHP